jgi:hypothetical protein
MVVVNDMAGMIEIVRRECAADRLASRHSMAVAVGHQGWGLPACLNY